MLSSCSDAYVALGRIGAFLTAEELGEAFTIDPDSKYAVQVDGDFAWETSLSLKNGAKEGGKNGKQRNKSKPDRQGQGQSTVLPTTTTTPPDEATVTATEDKPFELRSLQLKIPKGAFVTIVGRVGSGKSSLLQGMIGEMRKTRGEVCCSVYSFMLACTYLALRCVCRWYSVVTLHMFRRQRG